MVIDGHFWYINLLLRSQNHLLHHPAKILSMHSGTPYINRTNLAKHLLYIDFSV